MLRSSAARGILAVVAAIVLLGVLRYKPWQRAATGPPAAGTASAISTAATTENGRQKLTVGFLPVT
jgi:hypothetical protein